MRYWLYQRNEILGPYELSELAGLPSYSGKSLVCLEGSKGNSLEDWQTAESVRELSLTLSPVSSLPGAGTLAPARRYPNSSAATDIKEVITLAGLQGKIASLEGVVSLLLEQDREKDGKISSLREEMEERTGAEAHLKGVIAHGNFLARISELETALSALREQARHKDAEILSLDGELEQEARAGLDLKGKYEKLSERLAGHSGLCDRLGEAVASEKRLMADAADQRRKISEMAEEITGLRHEMAAMMPRSTSPSPPEAVPAKPILIILALAALAAGEMYLLMRSSPKKESGNPPSMAAVKAPLPPQAIPEVPKKPDPPPPAKAPEVSIKAPVKRKPQARNRLDALLADQPRGRARRRRLKIKATTSELDELLSGPRKKNALKPTRSSFLGR